MSREVVYKRSASVSPIYMRRSPPRRFMPDAETRRVDVHCRQVETLARVVAWWAVGGSGGPEAVGRRS